MRKSLEMYTVSRMQHLVQNRKKLLSLRPNYFFICLKKYCGALGVESSHGGAINILFSLLKNITKTCMTL